MEDLNQTDNSQKIDEIKNESSNNLNNNNKNEIRNNVDYLYEKLIKMMADYKYSEEEINFIKKAYQLSRKKHSGQLRASGEEYIIHPINVAINLVEMKTDCKMIATGLLHDVVEDTDYTLEELEKDFGVEVKQLVDGVTKISKLKNPSYKERQAETIRKMLLAMINDMRVIIIKLADKLHNMSTLEFLPEEKQKRIAKETLEIYAPLAGKLGLNIIKNQLENLSLKALKPDIYNQIENFVKSKESEKLNIISIVNKRLTQKLEKLNINFTIKSRQKHYYSIYNKMKKFNKKLEDIFDLFGIRIITETVEDCYTIFGIIHSIYKPVPGRFKDYIANPKSNGYRSLHTTVIVENRVAMEIQIRTYEMDQINEYGIAAHWLYKTGEKNINENLKWIENLKKVHQSELSPDEYYQAIRNEILNEEIYVFTPKGDLIELPKGATPLDFAYKIHTEVGHRCKGAKVNGKIIPLNSPLKNGAIVEIITGKDPNPKREWISIVKTSEAKKKISHYFSVLDKKEKEEKEAYLKENQLKEANTKEKPQDIRYSEFTPEKINNKVAKKTSGLSIEIDGEKNLLFSFAKCCKPNPPAEIVGYVSRGRGIIIHRKDCSNLLKLPEVTSRLLNVNWGVNSNKKILSFFMRTEPTNRSYLEITNVVKKYNGTIINFNLDKATKNQTKVDGYFSVELPINENEDNFFKELNNISSIYHLELR